MKRRYIGARGSLAHFLLLTALFSTIRADITQTGRAIDKIYTELRSQKRQAEITKLYTDFLATNPSAAAIRQISKAITDAGLVIANDRQLIASLQQQLQQLQQQAAQAGLSAQQQQQIAAATQQLQQQLNQKNADLVKAQAEIARLQQELQQQQKGQPQQPQGQQPAGAMTVKDRFGDSEWYKRVNANLDTNQEFFGYDLNYIYDFFSQDVADIRALKGNINDFEEFKKMLAQYKYLREFLLTYNTELNVKAYDEREGLTQWSLFGGDDHFVGRYYDNGTPQDGDLPHFAALKEVILSALDKNAYPARYQYFANIAEGNNFGSVAAFFENDPVFKNQDGSAVPLREVVKLFIDNVSKPNLEDLFFVYKGVIGTVVGNVGGAGAARLSDPFFDNYPSFETLYDLAVIHNAVKDKLAAKGLNDNQITTLAAEFRKLLAGKTANFSAANTGLPNGYVLTIASLTVEPFDRLFRAPIDALAQALENATVAAKTVDITTIVDLQSFRDVVANSGKMPEEIIALISDTNLLDTLEKQATNPTLKQQFKDRIKALAPKPSGPKAFDASGIKNLQDVLNAVSPDVTPLDILSAISDETLLRSLHAEAKAQNKPGLRAQIEGRLKALGIDITVAQKPVIDVSKIKSVQDILDLLDAQPALNSADVVQAITDVALLNALHADAVATNKAGIKAQIEGRLKALGAPIPAPKAQPASLTKARTLQELNDQVNATGTTAADLIQAYQAADLAALKALISDLDDMDTFGTGLTADQQDIYDAAITRQAELTAMP